MFYNADLDLSNNNIKQHDTWFDVNNKPLKWNLPFGVLYDSLAKDPQDLPVCVNVHFKNFPENTILRYKGYESFRFYYLNSVKESFTIMLGSSKEILNLSTKDTNRLLDIAVCPKNKSKEYFDLYNKLLEPLMLKLDDFDEVDKNTTNTIKTNFVFPIKFVFNNNDIILTKPYDIEEHGVDCLLVEFIAKVFDNSVSERIINGIDNNTCKIYICSIEFDLMTPVAFLAVNFSYLDFSTYIIINEE